MKRLFLSLLFCLISIYSYALDPELILSGVDLQGTGKIRNAAYADIFSVSATGVSTSILNVTGALNSTNGVFANAVVNSASVNVLDVTGSLKYTTPIATYYQPQQSSQATCATDFYNSRYASYNYYKGTYGSGGYWVLGYFSTSNAYVIYKISTQNIDDVTVYVECQNYADVYTKTWAVEYSYDLNGWNFGNTLQTPNAYKYTTFKTKGLPHVYVKIRPGSITGGLMGSSLIGLMNFQVYGSVSPSANIINESTDIPGLLVTGKTLIGGVTSTAGNEVLNVSGGADIDNVRAGFSNPVIYPSTWTLSVDTPCSNIYTYSEAFGKLFVTTENAYNVSYDGQSWTTHITGAPTGIMYGGCTYNNKLYSTCYYDRSVYVYNGSTWSVVTTLPSGNYPLSLGVYNNKLYLGTYPNGYLYVYDGISWTLITTLNTAGTHIYFGAVYGGKMYLSVYSASVAGKLYSYDGYSFSNVYSTAVGQAVGSPTVHNDLLYFVDSNTYLKTWDGNSASLVCASKNNVLCSYNGKLYSSAAGQVYVFDGVSSWSVVSATLDTNVASLGKYDGGLFAGTSPNGYIYRYSEQIPLITQPAQTNSPYNYTKTQSLSDNIPLQLGSDKDFSLGYSTADGSARLVAGATTSVKNGLTLTANNDVILSTTDVMSGELVTGWTNNSSYPYETFTTSGSSITRAYNTTGYGICYSTIPIKKDRRYVATFTAAITSGSFSFASSSDQAGGSCQVLQPVVNGVNTVDWISGYTRTDYILFYTVTGVTSDFAISNFSLREVLDGNLYVNGSIDAGRSMKTSGNLTVERSSELVTNGLFTSDTSGWSGNTTISCVTNMLSVRMTDTADGYYYAGQLYNGLTVGKTYKFSVTSMGSNVTGGWEYIDLGYASSIGGSNYNYYQIWSHTEPLYPSNTVYTLYFTAVSPYFNCYLGGKNTTYGNTAYMYYDNVSLVEVGEATIQDRASIGSGAFAGAEVLNVSGDSYFTGNVSALSFTDRTPGFVGDALSEVAEIRNTTTDEIDHTTLGSTDIVSITKVPITVILDGTTEVYRTKEHIPTVIIDVSHEEEVSENVATTTAEISIPASINFEPTVYQSITDAIGTDVIVESTNAPNITITKTIKPGFYEKDGKYYTTINDGIRDISEIKFIEQYAPQASNPIVQATYEVVVQHLRDIGLEISRLNEAIKQLRSWNDQWRMRIRELESISK